MGMLIAFLFSFPLSLISLGIFGYNGVLCGIAFSGKEKTSLMLAIVSITLSVFIVFFMLNLGLIALTAPFVFASWIVILARKLLSKNKK